MRLLSGPRFVFYLPKYHNMLTHLQGRQALCESLPYYRAFQSAGYITGGVVYAFMAGRDNSERSYMDSEIMIVRAYGLISTLHCGTLTFKAVEAAAEARTAL